MSEAQGIKGFIENLLGEVSEEQVMVSNTITRAVRYDWQRESAPLEGQKLEQHKAWLEVWQRVEIQDIHSFPLWEKEVHDVPQNPSPNPSPSPSPSHTPTPSPGARRAAEALRGPQVDLPRLLPLHR